MKISELHVTGFRSLKDVTWKPGDLNVVIGPNASGKSNLLRALEMLSESAQGQLAEYVQSNDGIAALLWDSQNHGINLDVSFVASSHPSHFTPGSYHLNDFSSAHYHLAIMLHVLSDFRVVEENLFVTGGPKNPSATSKISLIDRVGNQAWTYDDNQTPYSAKNLALRETILSAGDNPFVQNIFLHAAKTLVADLKLYQGLDVGRRAKLRQPVITQFANQLDLDGENLTSVLHTLYTHNSEFEEAIDDGMRAAFGDYERLKFPPASEQRIQLELKWKSLKKAQNATYLSDGTLKFLSLLTILVNPAPPPLIAIDEPETGLHPRMFPIIAEFAAEASRKTQVVFTTHSPQFLDAFRDQIPTVTVARWEEGQTQLNTLDGSELKRWLNDFSLGSMFKSGELEAMA